MKALYTYLLLFCIVLLHGCIGEDEGKCPKPTGDNLILNFLYTDLQGNDIFPQRIHRVDAFFYDATGSLVLRQSVDQAALSAFAGVKLNLQPGEYRVVCWANAFSRTLYSGANIGNMFDLARIGNPNLASGAIVANGDSLRYAPAFTGIASTVPPTFTVTIPQKGSQTASISFGRAFVKIAVYVKNFNDNSLPPVVELTDIPASYDFELQTSATLIFYQDVSSYQTVNGQTLANINFDVPLFDGNTPTQVLIKKQSDGSTVTTVNLLDFIAMHKIVLQHDTPDMIIPILIEYDNLSDIEVQITLPGVEGKPVTPGL